MKESNELINQYQLKINSIIIFCSFLFMLNTSCSKYIDYHYNAPPDKLVVMASISPQEGLNIKLTHSLAPTGTHYFIDKIGIPDASVILIINDTMNVSVPHYENGYYYLEASEFQFMPGSRYRIKVETFKYGITESSEIIMPEKAIVSYNGFEADKRNINGDTCIHASFILQDNDTLKNTYYYNSRISSDDYPWSYLLTSDFEYEICEMADYSDFHCFTDLCMNKPIDTLKFEIQTIYRGLPVDYFEIKISSTSESLYKYVESALQPEGNIELAFSEPRISYTNFNNAYGVFYAENLQWIKVSL